jgi:putative membrane protein
MCWPFWGGNWFMGFLMMLFGFLIFVGILLLIIWVVVRFARQSGGIIGESPLDVLKKRYARGEISQEEYERMKTELS